MTDNESTTATRAANQAMIAVIAISILTSIHHVYGGLVDSLPIRLLVPVIVLVPLGLSLAALNTFKQTNNRTPAILFAVIAILFFVIGLGIVHGGYSHVYKDILYLLGGTQSQYYSLNPGEHFPPDNLFFELTGDAEAIAGFFVALTTIRVLRASR